MLKYAYIALLSIFPVKMRIKNTERCTTNYTARTWIHPEGLLSWLVPRNKSSVKQSGLPEKGGYPSTPVTIQELLKGYFQHNKHNNKISSKFVDNISGDWLSLILKRNISTLGPAGHKISNALKQK